MRKSRLCDPVPREQEVADLFLAIEDIGQRVKYVVLPRSLIRRLRKSGTVRDGEIWGAEVREGPSGRLRAVGELLELRDVWVRGSVRTRRAG